MNRWFRLVLGVAALARLFGPVVVPRFPGRQIHPWPIPGRTVFVGDREFLVREAGDPTAPPVVLIHGLAGSSLAEWYRVGPILAENRRVLLVDSRGHGLSAQTPVRYEIDEVADELAGVLVACGVEGATVVGYSLGGTIAQALVHRHPDLVGRLVLIATFGAHSTTARVSRIAGLVVARAWERLTGLGTPDVRSAYLLGTHAVDPTHARWLWEETHRRDPDAGAQAAFAMLRFDSRDWIGEIGVPTTVVIPTRDQLVPTSWQVRLAEGLMDADVVEVEGGRHELPWTHPELIARIIAGEPG
jgi:3-oxoadipate enol-lactonase